MTVSTTLRIGVGSNTALKSTPNRYAVRRGLALR